MSRTTLKQAREAAGLKQHQVADALGISESQISRIERGLRKATFEQAQHMAKLYKINLADINGRKTVDLEPSEWKVSAPVSAVDRAKHIFAATEGVLRGLGLTPEQVPDIIRLLTAVSEAELPDAQDEDDQLRMRRSFALLQIQQLLGSKVPKRD
jgi:transcriptional regulator with XRE-family HTH domain